MTSFLKRLRSGKESPKELLFPRFSVFRHSMILRPSMRQSMRAPTPTQAADVPAPPLPTVAEEGEDSPPIAVLGSGGELVMAPGAELAVQEAVRAKEQARERSLQADADGAMQILKKLVDIPRLREYNALRAALHDAHACAFLTHQTVGLGLGYTSGTGFLIRRLPGKGGWSAPCYYTCHGLSVGALAGYEYVQQMVCIHSERTLRQFATGEMHAALTATLLAGGDLPRDMAARPARIDSVPADAAIRFTLAGGVIARLSLQVGWMRPDRSTNRRLFGGLSVFGTADVAPLQLLSRGPGSLEPPEEFGELYKLLDKLTLTWQPHRWR